MHAVPRRRLRRAALPRARAVREPRDAARRPRAGRAPRSRALRRGYEETIDDPESAVEALVERARRRPRRRRSASSTPSRPPSPRASRASASSIPPRCAPGRAGRRASASPSARPTSRARSPSASSSGAARATSSSSAPCRRCASTSSGSPCSSQPLRRALDEALARQPRQRGGDRRAPGADQRGQRAMGQPDRHAHAIAGPRVPSARPAPTAARACDRRRAAAGRSRAGRRGRARGGCGARAAPSAIDGQRPAAMATRVSRIATRAGVCTCQLAETGSASKATSSSQGRRMSPAPSSSVVVRPAKSRSRREHAVDEQDADHRVDVAELARAGSHGPGSSTCEGTASTRAAAARSCGIEALAELGLDVEEVDRWCAVGTCAAGAARGALHRFPGARALNHRARRAAASTSCAPSRAMRERGTTWSKPAASARSRTSGCTWAKKPRRTHAV